MKIEKLFLLLALIFSVGVNAQETFPPTDIITGTYLGKTGRLDEFPTIDLTESRNTVPTMVLDQLVNTSGEVVPTTTIIQNLQTEPGQIEAMPLEQNFIGASAGEAGGVFPPDPTGAVGPNHYMHSVNLLVKIFDKTGNLLLGPTSIAAFLGISNSPGDPIVLYDQLADRWVMSAFGSLNNSLVIGVSETGDPTGAYNVWQYQFPGFPDYPKYSTWHDGYYGTVNLGGQTTRGFVMERDVMLAGGANPQILIFQLPQVIVNPNQVKSPVAANLTGTTIDTNAPGLITYLQDDGWTSAITFDHLKVWEIEMDWNNPSNSTISAPQEIPTDPFDAGELFGNGNGALRQPNTSQRLAAHGGIISFNSNYREFGTHDSWLITFNTFIDGNQTGGIRWIELRKNGANPWAIFQEGTYSIADGHSRVMSSAAMDALGNIAMGYTTGSTGLAPSLRYTGRFDGDPMGTMTVAETTIINGPGVRTNSNRYGDYAHMTMDPDDLTFWFTSDYFSSNNQWRTQIASLKINPGFTDDVGINNILEPNSGVLTSSEAVQVSIRNYGSAPKTNIPLELRVDGNLVANETFTGTIPGSDTAIYNFTQTLDLSNTGQTYSIEVRTNLPGDEFANNDSFTKEVTSLFANDTGVLEITSPVSGTNLNSNETISVTVRNFGATPQSNFPVQYTINGGDPVVETFTGTLTSEDEASFDFATTGDFNELGTYTIVASTNLSGDEQPSNDEATAIVESLLCQPAMSCSAGDGFRLVSIAEINNPSGCEGYGDFTNLLANLGQGSSNDLTLTTGRGNQYVSVWIDFSDNYSFSGSERLINNFVIAPGQGTGEFTETLLLEIPADAPTGEHIMRIKSNRNNPVPGDACQETTFGETEDYLVNIGILGVSDEQISQSELIVLSKDNNQFEVKLHSEFDEAVYLGVYNMLGQEIGFNKSIPKIDGAYRANLDMSQMSSGVYLLRIGGQTTTSYQTARIIVK
ncbi:MAG: T9SS type A sorting domain-containing protein [Bacteroidia bacterium]|nr:T9SS type A sorting domain-containing protein [Bacteroidia bacterium]NNF31162.1 T9SS type A sorting domain-containing protein [Flavobacteriaceae bacterium]NNK54592.1 T9SS type A sorting domain-containing protein [Flavobacteriaceae bacterium]NNM09552.1 T9SS type A sorting domain-containing protein [Flavobacteriaceae bacterium]